MSDHWLYPYELNNLGNNECGCTKQQEKRQWERTVFVPDGMQPIDIIESYSFDLPLPPFFAMQPSVNKFDVECIASAMANPQLHWHTVYHFTIAPFEHFTAGDLKPARLGSGYDPEDYLGKWVLISGHHRFLAFLLSGKPPANLSRIQVIKAPLATSMFPWSVVEWGH